MATATAQTTDTPAQRELERRMLHQMLLIRRFRREGRRSVRLGQDRRLLSSLHRPEAVAVGSLSACATTTYVISSYREHGQALARGVAGERHHGRAVRQGDGLLEGEGWLDAPVRRRTALHGGHGIVGGHIPLAAGLGFAIRYKGGDQVCICYFGEAAVNIGAFHETLNMASVYKLPVILLVREQPLRHGHGVRGAWRPSPMSWSMPAATTWRRSW